MTSSMHYSMSGTVNDGLRGFPDQNTITARAAKLHGQVSHYNDLRIYPDMTFSCDVTINSVTVLGYSMSVPSGRGIELQLWEPTVSPISRRGRGDPDSCRQYQPQLENIVTPLIPPAILGTSVRDAKKIILPVFSPVFVREGSVLAIHQLSQQESFSTLLYQEGGGPQAYSAIDSCLYPLDHSAGGCDYPLIALNVTILGMYTTPISLSTESVI